MINIYGEESNKGKIIEILSIQPNLTAKQIYHKLKTKYGVRITYQGIHKILLELVRDKILEKNKKYYCVNIEWLDNLQYYSSNLRKKLVKIDLQSKDKEELSGKIKYISFDQTGSLFDDIFDKMLWYSVFPQAYARQYKIPREKAYQNVISAYRENFSSAKAEWRDPDYWIKFFKLKITFDDLVKKLNKYVKPYPDAVQAIKSLSRNYKLIIISSASRSILGYKLKLSNLEEYFSNTFSISSDFKLMNPIDSVYKDVCRCLGININQLVHIGNKYEEDYQIPLSVGIRSFLIDRSGTRKGPFIVRDLNDFQEKIYMLEIIKNEIHEGI